MHRVSAQAPLTADAAAVLFSAVLPPVPAPILLAVSGGPDSTALMGLYATARTTHALPAAIVVTVNHGLRPEAQQEAVAVGALARKLGYDHRILAWTGAKPQTGLQDAARVARYRLIGDLAASLGARAVMMAHTLDDQAETILMRMSRGSGLAGLAGMEALGQRPGFWLARPFLDVPKAALVATCHTQGWAYADDPSNGDERFSRVRLRRLMPLLAAEGLDARRFAALGRRMRAAEYALETVARRALTEAYRDENGRTGYDVARLAAEPSEVVVVILRQLLNAQRRLDDKPVRLCLIEGLAARFLSAAKVQSPFAATLGGVHLACRNNRLMAAREGPRATASLHKKEVRLGNGPNGS